MKLDLLGAKWVPSAGLTDQMVMPVVGLPSPSVHVKAAPPQSWTSMPRCFLYQAHKAFGSLALMKMPPMPFTLRMLSPLGAALDPKASSLHPRIELVVFDTGPRERLFPMGEREVFRDLSVAEREAIGESPTGPGSRTLLPNVRMEVDDHLVALHEELLGLARALGPRSPARAHMPDHLRDAPIGSSGRK